MVLIFVSAASSAKVDDSGTKGKPLENVTNFPITHPRPSSAGSGLAGENRAEPGEWPGSVLGAA